MCKAKIQNLKNEPAIIAAIITVAAGLLTHAVVKILSLHAGIVFLRSDCQKKNISSVCWAIGGPLSANNVDCQK